MEKNILKKAIWANFSEKLEIAIEYDIILSETVDIPMGVDSLYQKHTDLVHNIIFDFIDFLGLDGTDEDIVEYIGKIIYDEIAANGYFKNLKF